MAFITIAQAIQRLMRRLLFFCGALILAGAVQACSFGAIIANADNDQLGYAAGSAFLLVWLLSSVRWHTLPQLIKRMGVWFGVLFVLILGYGLRPELLTLQDRFLAILMPDQGFSVAEGSWSLYKSADGHFYAELLVNGVPIRFLVDTGASDLVLTREDALKIGLFPERLAYTKIYQSANGQTRGAPIILDEVRLGGLILQRMPASVNAGAAHISLLGMTFFKRLDSYDVKHDLLTLHWHVK